MAKKNILSTPAVMKKLKEVDELRKKVEDLQTAIFTLEDKLNIVLKFLNQKSEPELPKLEDDTWDPSMGPIPEKMKKGKLRSTVHARDKVVVKDENE